LIRLATACRIVLLMLLTGLAGSAFAADAHAGPLPRKITVVLDDNFPPYTLRDASGQLQGLVRDRWRQWQEQTGIEVELRGMEWAQAQQVMRDGGADVIDTISRTPAREPLYDFSAPYADLDVMLYFRTELSGIVDAASSRNFIVGVKDGDRCVEQLAGAGSTNLARFPTYALLVAAAAHREVDVFCMNQRPAEYFLAKAGIRQAFRHTQTMYTSQFHWAVRKGDAPLLRIISDGFARIPPEASRELEEKWFGSAVEGVLAPYLRYGGYGLLALLATLLVMAAWIYSMRTAVRHKTAALEEERARFKTLFQTLPDPAWLKNPDGVVLACNAAYEHLLGKPESALIGQRDEALMERQLADGFRESDRQAMAADAPIRYEEWLDLPTLEHPRLFQTTKTRMHDAAGHLLGILGVARDITDLHSMQTALGERIREQKCLYAIFRASDDLHRPLPDMLQEVTSLLPSGWRHPQIAAACIDWSGQHYATADLDSAVIRLSTDIRIGPRTLGHITVAYLQPLPDHNGGDPFVDEERDLIEAVAERLASVHQRRVAEDHLSESEERFRKLFEDTRQAITLVEDGRFVAANKASLAMLRIDSAGEFLGRTPIDISPVQQPDGRLSSEKVLEVIRIALEKGSHEFEWEHIRADGEHFIAHVLLTAIRQGSKNLLHVVWNDISEQKRAATELDAYRQELEQRVAARTAELLAINEEQQALFDAATLGIVLLKDRTASRCNRRMHEMLGWPDGELTGRSTRAWYVDDAAFNEVFDKAYEDIRQGLTHHREQMMVRRDGTRLWTRMTGRAVAPGDPGRGSVWIIDDITAERAAAEAVRLANEEQQAIFDAATVGIALTRDRTIQRCNRTMERMFGYGADEMRGLNMRAVYPDDTTFSEIDQRIAADLAQKGAYREEHEMLRKDGSRFWCRMMVLAIDHKDMGKGFAGTFEDITAERAANAELAQTRLLAEAGARAKSDFLANMSHEIRTPMNAVIGLTHLALKTGPTARQRDYLLKIQRSGQHLLGIINDILDFSKIDAGKMAVEHVEFELERILDNVAGLVAEKASDKGLELIVEVEDDVPNDLIGDPLRISQVLINYTNNAVKFTTRGEIGIHVRVAERMADDVQLHFSVRDTGIGIDEAQRQTLFQSFQQADTSTTRRYGGTGLGLVIAKRLAELMGGEVGVDSTPGQGATFWFTARMGRGRDTRERFLPKPDLRARRMLVVDDNEHARNALGDMLRSMTFVVGSAGSGQAALDELARAASAGEPYEIVFLDWQMPGMDGLATARKISELQLHTPPVVLMITAYGRDELTSAAAQAGIEEVLTKPVNPSLLFDTVMRVFGAAADLPQRTQPDRTAPAPDITAIAGARILLVEDNDLNQEVATELLHEAGLLVDLAPDGSVALEKVQHNSYDIVLMDMQMPVMDGLAATREIRRLPGQRDLPIVAMTANAMAGDRERCIDAGMNDHIAKPIDPVNLMAKLLQWIRPQHLKARNGSGGTRVGRPAPSASILEGIPGLDVATGLRQSMGRDALYLSLLSRFVSGQADAPSHIARLIGESDWPSAELVAHTLKGVAAQIGADGIRIIAERLEHAIRHREPALALDEIQADLAVSLPALIASIRSRLQPPDATPEAAAVDQAQLRRICAALADRLKDDDFSSRQLLDANEAMLRMGLGEHFPHIAEAIRDCDFGTALERLRAALPSGLPETPP
jgi:PAS domain S-box-containing protein